MRHVGEPAEVLIFGDQNATLAESKLHKFLIDRPLLKLAHNENVVTCGTQSPHHSEVAVLVREKSHPLAISGLQ